MLVGSLLTGIQSRLRVAKVNSCWRASKTRAMLQNITPHNTSSHKAYHWSYWRSNLGVCRNRRELLGLCMTQLRIFYPFKQMAAGFDIKIVMLHGYLPTSDWSHGM